MADSFTPALNMTKPEIDGSAETWGQKLNADLDLLDAFAGTTQAFIDAQPATIAAAIAAVLPRGCIIAWAGTPSAVPAGWLLCNGANGTPDLRDRFILGKSDTRPIWEAGGSFSSSGNTAGGGVHAHGGNTVSHVLAEAEMPWHNHGGYTDWQGWHNHSVSPGDYPLFYQGSGGNSNIVAGTQVQGQPLTIGYEGNHYHAVTTDYRGSNYGHVHGILDDGAHLHAVSVAIVPPYFALCYIMRA